jgi:ABC-type nitrate/sulfonate/bicarbonate transport system permease component
MSLVEIEQRIAAWQTLVMGWRRHDIASRVLAPTIALALLVGAWQAYAVWGNVNPLLLPTPLHVWQVTVGDWSNLQPALLTTLYETTIGFAWALAFGLISAALLDLVPLLQRGLYPLFVASQTIPIVAIAPLLQLWLGTELSAKVIIIVLSCFFPITVAGLDGLRATDPELIRLYRSFGASSWQIFRAVRLPNALPSLFSGIRIAITYSVISAIFSEYIGATQGLGVYLALRQHEFRVDLVIGAIVVTALATIALFLLTMVIERLAIPWFYAERQSKKELAS